LYYYKDDKVRLILKLEKNPHQKINQNISREIHAWPAGSGMVMGHVCIQNFSERWLPGTFGGKLGCKILKILARAHINWVHMSIKIFVIRKWRTIRDACSI
jgi:hypothetical protein